MDPNETAKPPHRPRAPLPQLSLEGIEPYLNAIAQGLYSGDISPNVAPLLIRAAEVVTYSQRGGDPPQV